MIRRVALITVSLLLCASVVGVLTEGKTNGGEETIGLPELEYPGITGFTVAAHWGEEQGNWSETVEDVLSRCELRQAISPWCGDVLADSEELEELAGGLCDDDDSDIEKVFNIYEFVTNNLSYLIFTDFRNATEVLSTGAGDCYDKSVVLVSLLRNQGFDAYVMSGGDPQNGASHAWVVARVDNSWVPMDPTVSDFSFVYDCLNDNECEQREHYERVWSMFNEQTFLECK